MNKKSNLGKCNFVCPFQTTLILCAFSLIYRKLFFRTVFLLRKKTMIRKSTNTIKKNIHINIKIFLEKFNHQIFEFDIANNFVS